MASYSEGFVQVERGLSNCESTPGNATGTSNPNTGSCLNSASWIDPFKIALTQARVVAIDMRLPTPYGPPDQPELTKKACDPCFSNFCCSKSAYRVGCNVIKAAPKHVENVAVGSLTPRSVPATFAVYPDKNWYIACPDDSFAIGGKTPKASQDKKITFSG